MHKIVFVVVAVLVLALNGALGENNQVAEVQQKPNSAVAPSQSDTVTSTNSPVIPSTSNTVASTNSSTTSIPSPSTKDASNSSTTSIPSPSTKDASNSATTASTAQICMLFVQIASLALVML